MRALTLWALFGSGLVVACTVDADYEGAAFQCSETEPCQAGYECVDDVCRLEGTVPDASTVDAGPDDCLPPIPLSDGFDGPAVSDLWTVTAAAGTSATIVDGVLQLSATTANNDRFVILSSKESYEFANQRVFIDVSDLTGSDGATLSFLEAGVGSDAYFLGQTAGELIYGLSQSGSRTTIGSASYVAGEHRFWQLRQLGDEMIGEVSSDGQSWTEIGRSSTANLNGALQVRLRVGTEESVAEPGTLSIDALNLGAALCE